MIATIKVTVFMTNTSNTAPENKLLALGLVFNILVTTKDKILKNNIENRTVNPHVSEKIVRLMMSSVS